MARGDTRSTDPRAVDTRRRLLDAFVALASDRDVVELTVSDLVERAGLNRSSFYAHFDSTEELALFALDQQLEPVHERNLTRHVRQTMTALDSNTTVIAEILDQVTTPPGYLAAALRHDRPMAENALGDQLGARVSDYFRRLPAYAGMTDTTRTITAEYVGHALASGICAWLTGDLDLGREDLIELLALLVPSWVMAPPTPAGA